MSDKNKGKGTTKNSATFRRTWDKAYYAQKARAKDEEEVEPEANHPAFQPLLVPRKPLVARDQTIDLASKVGRTQVVAPNTPLSQQAGFYCEVCDCVVKDSANWLDHINGKNHQKALGYSMRPERSTLQQVQEKLKLGKRKKEEEEKYDFNERMERLRQEEEKRKQERKERKRQKKNEDPSLTPEEADAMASFGLPLGFGGKKL